MAGLTAVLIPARLLKSSVPVHHVLYRSGLALLHYRASPADAVFLLALLYFTSNQGGCSDTDCTWLTQRVHRVLYVIVLSVYETKQHAHFLSPFVVVMLPRLISATVLGTNLTSPIDIKSKTTQLKIVLRDNTTDNSWVSDQKNQDVVKARVCVRWTIAFALCFAYVSWHTHLYIHTV